MIKEILFSLKFYLYKYDPDCDPERGNSAEWSAAAF